MVQVSKHNKYRYSHRTLKKIYQKLNHRYSAGDLLVVIVLHKLL